jgi:hypothetical protein
MQEDDSEIPPWIAENLDREDLFLKWKSITYAFISTGHVALGTGPHQPCCWEEQFLTFMDSKNLPDNRTNPRVKIFWANGKTRYPYKESIYRSRLWTNSC